jgi:hypothetical protein
MRRTYERERPRFGSVWTWGGKMDYLRLMALAPGEKSADEDADGAVLFLDLTTGQVTDGWGWVTGLTDPETGWFCVDEGPDGAPRV